MINCLFQINTSSAIISEDGVYRYLLTRTWDESLPNVCFVMLNPSTADANADDPTIRRCIRFANGWGFGSITVVNIFAYRSTNPRCVLSAQDPYGPENAVQVANAIKQATVTVAAWGCTSAIAMSEIHERIPALAITELTCLGVTLNGSPRHPLYVPASTPLQLLPAPPPQQI